MTALRKAKGACSERTLALRGKDCALWRRPGGQPPLNGFLIGHEPPQVRLHVVQHAQLLGAVPASPLSADLREKSLR